MRRNKELENSIQNNSRFSREEADFYGISFKKNPKDLEVSDLKVKAEKEKFAKGKSKIIEERDFYGMRIRNMQPAMVEFATQDSLERSLMAELENFDAQNDDYLYDEQGVQAPNVREQELEAQALNLVKQTPAQVLAQQQAATQKPVNKTLLVGGAAALAALFFMGGE